MYWNVAFGIIGDVGLRRHPRRHHQERRARALYLVIVLAQGSRHSSCCWAPRFVALHRSSRHIPAIVVLFLFGIMLARQTRRIRLGWTGVSVEWVVVALLLLAVMGCTAWSTASVTSKGGRAQPTFNTAAVSDSSLLILPSSRSKRLSVHSVVPSSRRHRRDPRVEERHADQPIPPVNCHPVLFCISVYSDARQRNSNVMKSSCRSGAHPSMRSISTSVAFGVFHSSTIAGDVFGLFVIAIAAARSQRGPGDGPSHLPQQREHRFHRDRRGRADNACLPLLLLAQ